MDKKSLKSFCVLPWIHSFVNTSGDYQVCCTSEEFPNSIIGDDGKKLTVMDQVTISQVMNSQYMKDLRLKMLNGNWERLCFRCKITEDNDGYSRRNIENRNYQNLIDGLIEKTEKDGTIHNEIISADYRLGNLCNLQCRMCNPGSTYLWIKEWNAIKPKWERYKEERIEEFKRLDWINSDHLIFDVKNKAHKLEHLHFAGGEPLIVPQMKNILEVCIAAGVAKNIQLTYNTNITKLPPQVVELWKEFKEVRLLVSIDAFGDLNSYIRYPSKWEIIDANLKTLDEHHKKMNVSEVLLSTTVQILNILHLDKLYKYLSQFKFIKKAPNLVNLHVPIYFQTTHLPNDLKKEATEKLLKIVPTIKDKVYPEDQYLVDNIQQVINFMNSQDNSQNLLTFSSFQTAFDRKRKLQLFDVFPEIKPYIKTALINAVSD